MANECIRPTKINCCLLRHRRFCVFTAALIVFTLRKKNCVCFRSFPELFWVRSVSLLIVIIVSKAFMSKACMVVSGISCHCIWTNTDYYNNKKMFLPASSKFWKLAWEANKFFCLALQLSSSKQELSFFICLFCLFQNGSWYSSWFCPVWLCSKEANSKQMHFKSRRYA